MPDGFDESSFEAELDTETGDVGIVKLCEWEPPAANSELRGLQLVLVS